MRIIDDDYALMTFIDNEIDLTTVYPHGDWKNTFEHGVNCGLENACNLLQQCPTIHPYEGILQYLDTRLAALERTETTTLSAKIAQLSQIECYSTIRRKIEEESEKYV